MDTVSRQSGNPALPFAVKLLAIVVLLFLINGSLHLYLPSQVRPRWPWVIPPFNSRYIGSIYLAEAVTVVIFIFKMRWSPGQLALLAAVIFTGVATAATFIHFDQMLGGKRTALWFFLYIGYFILTLGVVARYWHLTRPNSLAGSGRFRAFLQVLGAIFLLYGVLLIAAPVFATGFWPWPVDGLHARIYSGVYIATGVGLIWLAQRGTSDEYQLVGTGMAVWSAGAMLGLFLAANETGKAALPSAGAFGWLISQAVTFLSGVILVWRASAAASRN